MDTKTKLINGLIEEAIYDEVGLWMIVSGVQHELQITDLDSVRAETLAIATSMLESGRVAAAYYSSTGSGYEHWEGNIAKVIERIATEWKSLDRLPGIGEIVVLVRPK